MFEIIAYGNISVFQGNKPIISIFQQLTLCLAERLTFKGEKYPAILPLWRLSDSIRDYRKRLQEHNEHANYFLMSAAAL